MTRICPTDMLFQRMGRLWRHDEGPRQMRRPAGACREAWILTPDLEEALQNPMKAFGKTGYVYSPYVLCRTLEQWAQRRSVRLPDDIRPVLEATYADRDETDSPLALALRKLEEDKRALRNHAYDSTAQWGNTVSEETVTTRAMQRPEADVLLLRSRGMNGGQCLLADGSEVTFPARSPEWRERARIASRLMANIVRSMTLSPSSKISGSTNITRKMDKMVPRPRQIPMDATVGSEDMNPIKSPAAASMEPDVMMVGNA